MASMSMQRETQSDQPPSSAVTAWKYDVFLSFRGEDTRKTFISHLYSALDRKGIFTFKDNPILERGKVISLELLKAIEESRFSVIVFSENYAFSTWCLNELTKILECMKERGQIVFPVFYHINPSDVRKQTGSFEKAFAEHEKNFREDLEKVEKWRFALTEIANLSGWHLRDSEESKFIEDIVDDILSKMSPTLINTTWDLVGMESRIEKMDLSLCIGLNSCRMLGIYGMGGIGKTTIARFVFDKISHQFDGSSFLTNVREASMTRGLVSLQQQLISEIWREKKLYIWNVHSGCNEIRKRLQHRKVLVILDDVDQLEQLQALAGSRDWFGFGSIIVITTRDRHLLVSHGVDNLHMVDRLSPGEALELFCWKAFRKRHPIDDYSDLSLHMVNYADGLPLALEILGSFLFGRSKAQWTDALDRLKKVPDERIFQILKISYDGLQELEKKIFLDIACFFKGRDKDEISEVLNICDFNPDIGINILIDKCIITLSNNILCMHDLIQSMGREIVRQECPERPGQRSRLWLSNDVYRVLTKNEGTEVVECIIPDLPIQEELKLNAKSFSRMNSLRILEIEDVSLSQDLEYLSEDLRVLKWHGYPLSSLPSNFQHIKLYQLNMCYSHVKRLWKGVKYMNWLKIIILSNSDYLRETPDFTGVPNLERLILDGCTRLSFVHPSIGLLKRLVLLDLKDCKQLKGLRTQTEWNSLEVLILSGCSKLTHIQEIVAKCLLQLLLDGTSIKKLPSAIQHLTRLKVLNLNDCSKLEKLPEDLGHLTSLENLDLGGTVIHLPSSIMLLKNLKQLSFHGCKGQPHKSWSPLSLFSMLSCHGCLSSFSNPRDFPAAELAYSSGLRSLTSLDLGDCHLEDVGVISSFLGCLPSLTKLNLSRNIFVCLPSSIETLPRLETLIINDCNQLHNLSAPPASIKEIHAQNCTSLESVSISLSLIFTSTSLLFDLSNCFKLAGNQASTSNAVTFFKNVLQSLLKRPLQVPKCGVTRSELDLIIPGFQVPDWFTYCGIGHSLSILSTTNVDTNTFKGLALCAAFLVHHTKSVSGQALDPDDDTLKLECALEVGEISRPYLAISFHINLFSVKSDHLWICYVSRSYLGENFLPDRSIRACFTAIDHQGITLEVKTCGIRPIFDSDMEAIVEA